MKILLLFASLIINPIESSVIENNSSVKSFQIFKKGKKNKSGRYKKKKGLFKKRNGCDCPKH